MVVGVGVLGFRSNARFHAQNHSPSLTASCNPQVQQLKGRCLKNPQIKNNAHEIYPMSPQYGPRHGNPAHGDGNIIR